LQSFDIPTFGESIFYDIRPVPVWDGLEVGLAPEAGDKYRLGLCCSWWRQVRLRAPCGELPFPKAENWPFLAIPKAKFNES
jgi:hypothetical protein